MLKAFFMTKDPDNLIYIKITYLLARNISSGINYALLGLFCEKKMNVGGGGG